MNRQNSWLLLALPALLGGSELLVVALALAAAALVSLPLCSLALLALRQRLTSTALLIAALLIGATLLTSISLLLQIHSHELAQALGISLALLVLPCAGLVDVPASAWAGVRPGLAIAGLAIILGLLREALGHATLFAHADWMFGAPASSWSLVLPGFPGVALLTLVPGGFILLGLLLAVARLSPSANDRP